MVPDAKYCLQDTNKSSLPGTVRCSCKLSCASTGKMVGKESPQRWDQESIREAGQALHLSFLFALKLKQRDITEKYSVLLNQSL